MANEIEERVERLEDAAGISRVKYKTFRASFKSWTGLCDEATAFASSLEPGCLINISHASCAGHLINEAIIVVWYWDRSPSKP